MNFELTISGLNVIAIKSHEKRPKHPDAVDVISPSACMHRSRLSYRPEYCTADAYFKPELVVSPDGQRIAFADCNGGHYKITFRNDLYERKFDLKWSPANYNEPLTDELMDWLPSLDELGFKPFKVSDGVPYGAASRF